jgi:hypothetical protein
MTEIQSAPLDQALTPSPVPAPTPHPPSQRRRQIVQADTLQLLTLLTLLCLGSGAIGAMLIVRLFPPPPPLRISVVDVTRLSKVFLNSASAKDPGWTASLPIRLEYALAALQQANPDRIFLIKEAVVSGQTDDLTDAILPLLLNGPSSSTKVIAPPPSTGAVPTLPTPNDAN